MESGVCGASVFAVLHRVQWQKQNYLFLMRKGEAEKIRKQLLQ